MLNAKFLELSRITAQFYTGDDQDQRSYHLEVHCLLDIGGSEVVTQFSANLDQILQMGLGLDIPDDFPIQMEREGKQLGGTTFGEFKNAQERDKPNCYTQDPTLIGKTIQESIHDSFDGWTDEEKITIQRYLDDIAVAVANS